MPGLRGHEDTDSLEGLEGAVREVGELGWCSVTANEDQESFL